VSAWPERSRRSIGAPFLTSLPKSAAPRGGSCWFRRWTTRLGGAAATASFRPFPWAALSVPFSNTKCPGPMWPRLDQRRPAVAQSHSPTCSIAQTGHQRPERALFRGKSSPLQTATRPKWPAGRKRKYGPKVWPHCRLSGHAHKRRLGRPANPPPGRGQCMELKRATRRRRPLSPTKARSAPRQRPPRRKPSENWETEIKKKTHLQNMGINPKPRPQFKNAKPFYRKKKKKKKLGGRLEKYPGPEVTGKNQNETPMEGNLLTGLHNSSEFWGLLFFSRSGLALVAVECLHSF